MDSSNQRLNHKPYGELVEPPFDKLRARNITLSSLVLMTAVYSTVYADCPVFTDGAPEAVDKIVDGDTLNLTDGTKVRLAGIDTPELGRGQQVEAPLAQDAKHLLERIVTTDGQRVRLEPSQEASDHYGRRIAHVYTTNGRNINEQLLRAGLALGYARPPSLEHLDCYRAAEEVARNQHLGLWSVPPLSANTVADGTKGFVRMQGIVHQVNQTHKSVWIELGKRVALRVAKEDMPLFSKFNFAALKGSSLEARGYLYTYQGKLQMRIRHPADILTP